MKSGPKPRKNYLTTVARGTLAAQRLAPVEAMRPPSTLTAPERKVWRSVTATLAPSGIVTPADSLALALLCRAVARLEACERIIAAEGMTVDNHGQTVPHPATKIRDRSAAEVARLLRAFAMIPSARVRQADDRPVLDFNSPSPFDRYHGGDDDGRDDGADLLDC